MFHIVSSYCGLVINKIEFSELWYWRIRELVSLPAAGYLCAKKIKIDMVKKGVS